MKKTYYIKTIKELNQLTFEKSLQNIINKYEDENYEVEVQYSITKDPSLGTIYSALVMAYAYYNKNGYRIDH